MHCIPVSIYLKKVPWNRIVIYEV